MDLVRAALAHLDHLGLNLLFGMMNAENILGMPLCRKIERKRTAADLFAHVHILADHALAKPFIVLEMGEQRAAHAGADARGHLREVALQGSFLHGFEHLLDAVYPFHINVFVVAVVMFDTVENSARGRIETGDGALEIGPVLFLIVLQVGCDPLQEFIHSDACVNCTGKARIADFSEFGNARRKEDHSRIGVFLMDHSSVGNHR